MRLSFAWWNTALSPSGKPRANGEQKTFALDLLNVLLTEFEIDFIALGEVCGDDVRFFRQGLIDGFSIQGGNLEPSGIKFHTCFVWRKRKILVADTIDRVLRKGAKNFRLAQRVELVIADTSDKIHVFVSHWPSRRYYPHNSPIRHELGLRLRDAINEAMDKTPYIVLMGDYNDEPFDFSLSEQLQATRDRHFAQKKQQLLYNPFWRHMVKPLSSEKTPETRTAGGSYYHKQGDITHWRTFDQMIFSAAFLGSTEWRLNEALTGIIDIPKYSALVTKAKEIFDHTPIVGVIETEVDNG